MQDIIFLGLWLTRLAGCAVSTGNELVGEETAVPPPSTARIGETAVPGQDILVRQRIFGGRGIALVNVVGDQIMKHR